MRLLKHALVALSLGFVAFAASATPANPQNGVDYRTLEQKQQTDSGKKVEVVEFFWYSCPHCYALDPELEAWVKKQGDNINFRRIPVAFRESFVPQQKMFYALEALGTRWAARTGGRALTVHWGPWAPSTRHGGMVSAELGRSYARRGIELIDPEEGALSLLRELAWGDPAQPAVVYTASGW